MNAIACAINIAVPNSLETHQHVAVTFLSRLFHFVGERDRRGRAQTRERPEGPLILGPSIRSEELHGMAGLHGASRQPFQVSFRAAAGGKTATNKSNLKLIV